MWRIINDFPDYMINEEGIIYKIRGKKSNRIMQQKKIKMDIIISDCEMNKEDSLKEFIG